jgi:ribosomal protein S18 acetylase RimI-like enzyme
VPQGSWKTHGVLRQALRADVAEIIDIWTDAFVADPYLRWIQPDDERWPAFASDWFGFIVGLTFERGHTYIDDAGAAAIAWVPPDVTFVTSDDFARGVGILTNHCGAERAEAAARTIAAARAHGLEESHWTLQYIGVRSAAQGAGLGVTITAPILDRCTAERLPCSLVSSNTANVPFYRRLGFEVVAEVETPDGAACLRPMVRSA